MKAFFTYLLLAMILVAVAMVSALTAMRFAIHGREVTIPKLIGMTPGEAERSAADHGLALLRESKFYSSEVPAGRIVSQSPQPGSRVRRGWRVRVAESLGPQRVQVPDIVGQSPRAAELNVRRRGLEVGTIATVQLPSAVADTVIAQSPPANAQGVASPKLNLLVTGALEQPAFVMPDVTGMKLGEASVLIADAGLKVGSVMTAQQTVPPPPSALSPGEPIVVKHYPVAGQKVAPGMIVALEVVR